MLTTLKGVCGLRLYDEGISTSRWHNATLHGRHNLDKEPSFLAFFSSSCLSKYAFRPRVPQYEQASPRASRHSGATWIRLASIQEVCTHFCFLQLKKKKTERMVGNIYMLDCMNNLCFIHLGLLYLQNKKSTNQTTTTTPPRRLVGHGKMRKEQVMVVSLRPDRICLIVDQVPISPRPKQLQLWKVRQGGNQHRLGPPADSIGGRGVNPAFE
jgi:hypothetical protein